MANSSEVKIKHTVDRANEACSEENAQPNVGVVEDEQVSEGPNASSNTSENDKDASLWKFSSGLATVLGVIFNKQEGRVDDWNLANTIDNEEVVIIPIVLAREGKDSLDGIDSCQDDECADKLDSNIDWNAEQAFVVVFI